MKNMEPLAESLLAMVVDMTLVAAVAATSVNGAPRAVEMTLEAEAVVHI